MNCSTFVEFDRVCDRCENSMIEKFKYNFKIVLLLLISLFFYLLEREKVVALTYVL